MLPDDCPPKLIADAVAGDRLALERLLLAHSLHLSVHIAAKLPDSLRGALEVEDFLQQTFLRAFQSVGRLEHPTQRSFATWLKTIADNQLRDAVKGLRREKRGGACRRIRRPDEGHESSMADLVDLLCDPRHTPSRSAGRREAVQAVQVGIAGLPEDQQDAIRHHLLDGRSLAETAAVMDRTPGAVSALIHRAKQRLRDALGRASLWLSAR